MSAMVFHTDRSYSRETLFKMFIRGYPRIVSEDNLNSFIPFQRLDFVHRRIFGMANNDPNTWNCFQLGSQTFENWEDYLVDFNNPEPFEVSKTGL